MRLSYTVQLLISMLIFTGVSLISCNSNSASDKIVAKDTMPVKTPVDISIPGSFTAPTKIIFDSTALLQFFDSFPNFTPLQKELQEFYSDRSYSFAWYDEKGMIEPADNLYNRILNISEEGLPDKILYKPQFTHLMELEADQPKPSAQLDIMLTAQYLSYAKSVWSGFSKKELTSIEWLLPRKETPYRQLLDSLLTGKDVLKLAPVYRQYALLKSYLQRYAAIQANGGWGKIVTSKKMLKRGDSSEVIGSIRKHLFITGDISQDDRSAKFDTVLEAAVKKYQSRFGLTATGIITPTLISEMNQPVEKRIEQIVVNMERCRWVPVALNTDYLLVNIPDYKLHVYEKDSLVWSMNVVVGKNQHRTVVFNGDMKYVVFSPYWNIPPSILRNEVLPAIRRNSRYLASHNMEWNGGNVRQKPGPNNSLGLVKFLFPNSHNIYLHDSPAKSLFNEDKRAFSHGCIRLAEPKKLASYLLRNDTAWNEEKITKAMNAGIEKTVVLKKPMPVFIAYFTSWVDRSGQLNFRNDIYNRDSRLAAMIVEKPVL